MLTKNIFRIVRRGPHTPPYPPKSPDSRSPSPIINEKPASIKSTAKLTATRDRSPVIVLPTVNLCKPNYCSSTNPRGYPGLFSSILLYFLHLFKSPVRYKT